MATRWRFPEVLGGGERHAHHSKVYAGTDYAGFYVDGEVVWVPTSLLTEVEWPWELVTEYGATVGTQPIGTGCVNVWIRPAANQDTVVATLRPNIARELGAALTKAAEQAEVK